MSSLTSRGAVPLYESRIAIQRFARSQRKDVTSQRTRPLSFAWSELGRYLFLLWIRGCLGVAGNVRVDRLVDDEHRLPARVGGACDPGHITCFFSAFPPR